MKNKTRAYHDALRDALVAERIAFRFLILNERKEEYIYQSALAIYTRYKLRRMQSSREKVQNV